MVTIKRFDICLIALDPTVGSELKKTRPCVVVSPDSMNASRLKTIIIAPMTSTIRDQFPTRVDVEFQGKKGQIALDQLRVIDRAKVISVPGNVQKQPIRNNILHILQTLFS